VPRDPELPLYSAAAQCPVELCYFTEGMSVDSWGCDVDPYADNFLLDEDCVPEAARFGNAASFSNTSLEISDARILARQKRPRPPMIIDWYVLGRLWTLHVQPRDNPGATHLHDPSTSRPAAELAFRYVAYLFD
jgi:hypothetical protein